MPPGRPARAVDPLLAREGALERLRTAGAELADVSDLLDDARRRVLDDAASAVRAIFGAEADIALERFVDPEVGHGPDLVVLSVRARGSVSDTMRMMDELDEQFWLDVAAEQGRWLVIRPQLA